MEQGLAISFAQGPVFWGPRIGQNFRTGQLRQNLVGGLRIGTRIQRMALGVTGQPLGDRTGAGVCQHGQATGHGHVQSVGIGFRNLRWKPHRISALQGQQSGQVFVFVLTRQTHRQIRRQRNGLGCVAQQHKVQWPLVQLGICRAGHNPMQTLGGRQAAHDHNFAHRWRWLQPFMAWRVRHNLHGHCGPMRLDFLGNDV